MRASKRLRVVLRIPVAIEHDDGVRSDEVDALSAGSGGEQEQERAVLLLTAPGDCRRVRRSDRWRLPRASVTPPSRRSYGAPAARIILKNVQHARHLAEDERAMTSSFEPRQQLVEEL